MHAGPVTPWFADQPTAPVAIATCVRVASAAAGADWDGLERDDFQLIKSLRRRGIKAVHAVWDDPEVDWQSFALVVIRSTWDYTDRRDEFLTWASRLRRVLNPMRILRWNTDKRYLNDLARAGLPVIPTRFVEPKDVFEPPAFPFVVKPAVSCGAKDTARYGAGDEAEARDHVHRLQTRGRTVMIQPYLSDVEAKGEVSVLHIGGAYSHSICRDALLKQPGLPEEGTAIPLNFRAYEATPEERSLAAQVLSHVPGKASELLYARVDLIPGPKGGPMILEVELTEPSLFLDFSAGGVERLADGIVSALAKPNGSTCQPGSLRSAIPDDVGGVSCGG
jgi:glutathione synthase/RimK-type ligase-like ATP-grasp enzyme